MSIPSRDKLFESVPSIEMAVALDSEEVRLDSGLQQQKRVESGIFLVQTNEALNSEEVRLDSGLQQQKRVESGIFLVKTNEALNSEEVRVDSGLQQQKPVVSGIVPVKTNPKMNINRYATKKTIAQGMLDIALLTANASQLRYVLSLGAEHQFYEIMLGLIITSLILQHRRKQPTSCLGQTGNAMTVIN